MASGRVPNTSITVFIFVLLSLYLCFLSLVPRCGWRRYRLLAYRDRLSGLYNYLLRTSVCITRQLTICHLQCSPCYDSISNCATPQSADPLCRDRRRLHPSAAPRYPCMALCSLSVSAGSGLRLPAV